MSSPRETQQELRTALGYFWSRVFQDPDYVDALTASVAIRAQTTRELEDNLGNYLSRYTIPVYKIHDTRLFIFSTRTMDTAVDKYGEGRVYGDASFRYGSTTTDPDRPRFPIGDYVPPYLSRSILEPTDVLTLGTDYSVEDGYITFFESPLRDSAVDKTVITDTDGSYTTFQYWGFRAEEDQEDLCNFYGTVAGICGFSSEDLKEAINISWDLRVNGSSDSLLNRAFSLIADVDYVRAGGIAQQIYTEGDRRCVRTDTDVYTAPADAVETVVEGQTIFKNDTLFDSFQIHKGTEILSEEFLAGLTLSIGHIDLPSGGGMYFKNSYVPVTTYRPEGWYELERDGTNFIVRNRDGNIIDIVPEADATELIDAAPGEYYRFEVGGIASDIEHFFDRLNFPDEEGKTFFDRLADKYGRVPLQIKPFEEIRDFYLQANSIFVKLQRNLFPPQVTGQMLNIMKAVIPAGSTFFITVETPLIEESLQGGLEETVEVFYINDIAEDDNTNRTEQLTPVGYC